MEGTEWVEEPPWEGGLDPGLVGWSHFREKLRGFTTIHKCEKGQECEIGLLLTPGNYSNSQSAFLRTVNTHSENKN